MTTPGDIAAKIARHADHTTDVTPTPLDGVQLFRLPRPIPRLAGVYDPSICVVAQGTKYLYVGPDTHVYSAGHYLTITMPSPIEAEVRQASQEEPVSGVLISLQSRAMTELLVQLRSITPEPDVSTDDHAGLGVTAWDDDFTDALDRVMDLLDSPVDIELLGPGRLREMLYAILRGPAGAAIRNDLSGPGTNLTNVLTFIRSNLDRPLAIDDLAERAGMSRAAFDRNFKATTSLSPLKYLKTLRLNDAARLIALGTDIGDAATRVGYTNSSQFSREFKRQFGASPRAWAAANAGVADPQAMARR